MCMKLDVLHLTICNITVGNLNCTSIVTIDSIWGLNRKPKLTQELLNPNYLDTCINITLILSFYSWEGDYLMFLTLLEPRSLLVHHIPRASWERQSSSRLVMQSTVLSADWSKSIIPMRWRSTSISGQQIDGLVTNKLGTNRRPNSDSLEFIQSPTVWIVDNYMWTRSS